MRKLPFVPTLVAFIALVILLKLGFWQLSRAQEKTQIAEQTKSNSGRIYHSLSEAIEASQEHEFKRVKLTGSLDIEHLFYWDNRVLDGKVGYEVLVLLQSAQHNLLLNLGWVADPDFRRTLPEVTLPQNISDTVVVLYTPGMNSLSGQEATTAQWPKIVSQPDPVRLAKLADVEALPFIGYVEQPHRFNLQNNFKPVTLSPQKHLAYATQWFLLAVACLLVYSFALRKKWKDERK